MTLECLDEDIRYYYGVKAGAARTFTTIAGGKYSFLFASLVSAGKNAIRTSRAGASNNDIIKSANRAFGMSLFTFGAGKLLDKYYGTDFICEITSGEVFGGIMNFGN